jgi:hypothetical protein
MFREPSVSGGISAADELMKCWCEADGFIGWTKKKMKS